MVVNNRRPMLKIVVLNNFSSLLGGTVRHGTIERSRDDVIVVVQDLPLLLWHSEESHCPTPSQVAASLSLSPHL